MGAAQILLSIIADPARASAPAAYRTAAAPARSPGGVIGRVFVFLVVAAASGCLFLAPRPDVRPGAFPERTVVILVEGTPGLSFEGSYGTPAVTTPVRGVVPAQYTLKTQVAVAATFAKSVSEGELIVRVLVDGQEVARRSTTAPFGSVVVARSFAR